MVYIDHSQFYPNTGVQGVFLWFTLTIHSFTQTLGAHGEFLQFTLTISSFTQTLGVQDQTHTKD